jgi:hypothetical protein
MNGIRAAGARLGGRRVTGAGCARPSTVRDVPVCRFVPRSPRRVFGTCRAKSPDLFRAQQHTLSKSLPTLGGRQKSVRVPRERALALLDGIEAGPSHAAGLGRGGRAVRLDGAAILHTVASTRAAPMIIRTRKLTGEPTRIDTRSAHGANRLPDTTTCQAARLGLVTRSAVIRNTQKLAAV